MVRAMKSGTSLQSSTRTAWLHGTVLEPTEQHRFLTMTISTHSAALQHGDVRVPLAAMIPFRIFLL